MFIDTHCHLNFKAFTGGEEKIIRRAHQAEVDKIIVPGTDMVTSEKAVSIAQQNPDVYAVVGIHPHHAVQYQGGRPERNISDDMSQIERWLNDPKVVGIGEIGLDRHSYRTSRYGNLISISDELLEIQKTLFTRQVEIAVKHRKSIVIHNREAVHDLVMLCQSLKERLLVLKGRGVLHCCEPDTRLLELAEDVGFSIGVDGDVTYSTEKQDFIRNVPLELLVLETDAPYLLPEPLRTAKKYPNVPANIPLIAEAVARIKEVDVSKVALITTQNAIRLFHLPKYEGEYHSEKKPRNHAI